MSTTLSVARATSQTIFELRPQLFTLAIPQWNDRYTITPPSWAKQPFFHIGFLGTRKCSKHHEVEPNEFIENQGVEFYSELVVPGCIWKRLGVKIL